MSVDERASPPPATTPWVPLGTLVAPTLSTYKGDWLSTTQYQAGDIVVYGGILYSAVKGPQTNQAPVQFPPPSAQDAIPKSIIDAAGDLIVGTANDTVGRLAKGANLTVLGVDGSGVLGYQSPGLLGGFATKIAEVLLGATTATIDFTSIPATFRHLQLIVMGRCDANAAEMWMQLNGDATAANYQTILVNNSGTTPNGGTVTQRRIGTPAGSSAPANKPASSLVDLPNYRDTTFHKTWFARCVGFNGASYLMEVDAGWWANAAAINRITLLPSLGNLVAGSYAALWGIN